MRPLRITLLLLTASLIGSALAGPSLGQINRDPVNEPAMAPDDDRPQAGNVERILPDLLRADYAGPYPLAALRLGPEFWDAVAADAPGGARNNLFQGLFAGGLLFGIGPLDHLITVAQQAKGGPEPVARWAAPNTFAAYLELQLDEPAVTVTIQGESAEWVRKALRDSDPDSVIGQLEFVYFRLNPGGGSAPVLAQMARSMSLKVGGLTENVVHRFDWTNTPQQQQVFPPRQQQIFADRGPRRLGPSIRSSRPLRDRAMGNRGGFGGGAGEAAGMARPPADAEAMEPRPGEAWAPTEAPGVYIQPGAQRYPVARTASDVPEFGIGGDQPIEMYAGVDQVANTDGVLTLGYYTSPLGRQEVDVLSGDGDVVARLRSGPASRDGEAMASWRLPKAVEPPMDYAFRVRNTLDTPTGSHIAETLVPVLRDDPNEPGDVVAPTVAPTAALAVAELSVDGDLLNVRAEVPPIYLGRERITPKLHVRITDHLAEVVKTIEPTPPEGDGSYIFAWDCTNQDDERVDDGRYLLRLATGSESLSGTARSELRYWVDVPLAKTDERLSFGEAATGNVPSKIMGTMPGTLSLGADEPAKIAYWLLEAGRMQISIIDSDGRVVRHLIDEDQAKGDHETEWDGTDDAGQPMPDGAYTIHLEQNTEGDTVWATITVESRRAE